MKQEIIMLITAVLGTVGFSILFFLPPKKIPLAAIGGLMCCFVYLVMKHLTDSEFISNLCGALIAELYAQIAARIGKFPSTLVTFPSVIPLIPGGMLYRTMSALVAHSYSTAGQYGMTTLEIVAGIAAGMAIGTVIVSLVPAMFGKKANSSKRN